MTASSLETLPAELGRRGARPVRRSTSHTSRSVLARLGGATLLLLGPRSGNAGDGGMMTAAESYDSIVSQIQQFRGGVFLDDRAIPCCALDSEGRHRAPEDERSWHMLITAAGAKIIGCIRLRPHAGTSVEKDLGVNECVARMSPDQALLHEVAIREFTAAASRSGRPLCEPGGWAIRPDYQKSSAALILGCACWALGQLLGGTIGLAFANTYSATIIRRLGGFSLVPEGAHGMSVFDEYYRRDLELIAFDSTRPASAYDSAVGEIKDHLARVGPPTLR